MPTDTAPNNHAPGAAKKRLRFDPTTTALPAGTTNPAKAAESTISAVAATLHDSLQTLVKDSAERFINAHRSLQQREQQKERYSSDEDFLPSSVEHKFALTTIDKLEQEREFLACQQRVDYAKAAYKKALRGEITTVIDMELSFLKTRILQEVFNSLGELSRAFCKRAGLPIPYANALVLQTFASNPSDLLCYAYHSDFDISDQKRCLSSFFSEFSQKNPGNGEPIQFDSVADNDMDEEDDSNEIGTQATSPSLLSPPSNRRSTSFAPTTFITPDQFSKLRHVLPPFARMCKAVYRDAWHQYKDTTTQNKLELETKKQVELFFKSRDTAAPAMELEELTLTSKTLSDMLDEKLSKQVKPLQRKIAQLEQAKSRQKNKKADKKADKPNTKNSNIKDSQPSQRNNRTRAKNTPTGASRSAQAPNNSDANSSGSGTTRRNNNNNARNSSRQHQSAPRPPQGGRRADVPARGRSRKNSTRSSSPTQQRRRQSPSSRRTVRNQN
jgi:hypothetical protein